MTAAASFPDWDELAYRGWSVRQAFLGWDVLRNGVVIATGLASGREAEERAFDLYLDLETTR